MLRGQGWPENKFIASPGERTGECPERKFIASPGEDMEMARE